MKSANGFTIIEVMISLTLLVVVLGSMMTAVVTSSQLHQAWRCRERALESARAVVTDVQNRDYMTTGAHTLSGTTQTLYGVYDYYANSANSTFDVQGLTPPKGYSKVGQIALQDANGLALAAAPAATACIRVVITIRWQAPGASTSTSGSASGLYTTTYVHTQRQLN